MILGALCGYGDLNNLTPGNSAFVPSTEGCGEQSAPGSLVRTIVSSGTQRVYRVYVPESYRADTASPLVLNLHGFGSDADEQEWYSDLIDDAERGAFLLVTPQAVDTPPHWHVLGPTEPGYVDDVAFISDLLTALTRDFCVDAERVYAVGVSNGGSMVSLLACSFDDQLAAIAFVAGARYSGSCPGKQAVPVLAFHGTADAVIPFEGDPWGIRESIEDSVGRWAEHNACTAEPTTSSVTTDVRKIAYDGCREEVELYVIEGGGHTWPGTSAPKPLLGPTTQTIDASAMIWDFFARH